jgi:hypothetical protein
MNRRAFMQTLLAGLSMLPACRVNDSGPTPANGSGSRAIPFPQPPAADAASRIFWIKNIPDQPFSASSPNNHAGFEALLGLMDGNDLSFYKRKDSYKQSEAYGLIAADDVVLVKVNAQWKYRGCTNSDLIRGLVQRILDHPDGFSGEVVIIENGQGRGSLYCDTMSGYDLNSGIHANANDERHSFMYLVDEVFKGKPVSAYLLDPVRASFISADDHVSDGYRRLENISYPCFTSKRGTRIEVKEGVWANGAHQQNLKLINVPVLKHHDRGGSEITAALKHFYGLLTMSDGQSPARHYQGLGETCGKMVVLLRPPVLNIIDAIWVAHRELAGYPAEGTFRANQILASQDPVALDYWAAKNVLYPIDNNGYHHPDFAGISAWLEAAQNTINGRGGLFNPERGVRTGSVTRQESGMQVFAASVS